MRCFVALLPSRSLADRIAAWGGGAFAALPWARALPAESLHVTLAFLGELDPGDVERAGEIVTAVDPQPVLLRLGPELSGLPRRRPRVLALNVAGERIDGLHVRVSGDLVAAGMLAPPSRAPSPHLSVARIKRGALDGKRGRTTVAALPQLPLEMATPQPAARLALYRSELSSAGAAYTALAEIELPEG